MGRELLFGGGWLDNERQPRLEVLRHGVRTSIATIGFLYNTIETPTGYLKGDYGVPPTVGCPRGPEGQVGRAGHTGQAGGEAARSSGA